MYELKLSSTTAIKAASPRIRNFLSTEAAAARPISVLYKKNNKVVVKGISAKNKKVVVKGLMEDQNRILIDEGNGKKPAAAEGPPPPPLEDEISLRPFQLSDVDDIMAWGTDEELSRYCRWDIYKEEADYCGWETIKPDPTGLMGVYPVETYRYHGWDLETYRSKEDALEDMKNNIIPHPWYRAICLNNRPIGKIFIDPCSRNNPYMAALGYVVASEHWGKGIATTAVKMALDTIFNEWRPHLHRLEAHVHVENLGAQRVLEKAGFTKEGVYRTYFRDKEGRKIDIPIFSFLSTDFKK